MNLLWAKISIKRDICSEQSLDIKNLSIIDLERNVKFSGRASKASRYNLRITKGKISLRPWFRNSKKVYICSTTNNTNMESSRSTATKISNSRRLFCKWATESMSLWTGPMSFSLFTPRGWIHICCRHKLSARLNCYSSCIGHRRSTLQWVSLILRSWWP